VGKGYPADASRMAFYRDHCGHRRASSKETLWRFMTTTVDTKRAIALDKRVLMA